MSRRRPHDPAAMEQARQEKLSRQAEIQRLKAQGAEVNVDKRTGAVLSAYRTNVFNSLLRAGTITTSQHDAAYRLSVDWAAWKGLDGKPERPEYVDGGSGAAELVNDRMIAAGKSVERTLGQVGPMDRELLCAFMVATVEEDRPMRWQLIVEQVTGVTQSVRQSQMVVAALENLRRVFEEPRRAA